MLTMTDPTPLIVPANIPTWFHVGGGAERFCRPGSAEELVRCVEIDPNLRVLGDGANLLVDDDGVAELVVSLDSPAFSEVRRDLATGHTVVGAGADLPKLIVESVRLGFSGIEGLGGIPATVGGATIMNAGGAFGQIADAIVRVHVIDRAGIPGAGGARVLERAQIPFSYRHSGLEGLIITAVELNLPPGDPEKLRERLKEVMAYKKNSQPMKENSAGCAFKNPTLAVPLAGVTPDPIAAGQRVSAGMLIDKAGCKGLAVGGASVSMVHGNFLTTTKDAKARDVINLMREVRRRVFDRFGVEIVPEVVIWSRHGDPFKS